MHYLKRYRVCDVLTRHLVPRPRPPFHPLPPPARPNNDATTSTTRMAPAFVPGNCLSFCYFAASKSQTSACALSPCMLNSAQELHARLESTGWPEHSRTFNRKWASFVVARFDFRQFLTACVFYFFSRGYLEPDISI